MSESNEPMKPPSFLGTERRWGPRRLGGRPLVVAGVGAALVVGVAGYAIIAKNRASVEQAEAAPTGGVPSDAQSIIASIPKGGEIPAAARRLQPTPPPSVVQTAARAPAPTVVTTAPAVETTSLPPEDDIRAEAYRRAWQDYYAALGDWRRDQRQKAIEARMADSTAIREASAGGAGGAGGVAGGGAAENSDAGEALAAAASGGGAGAGLVGGAGGGGGNGRRAQPPRPGSLNQGPSSPATDYLPQTVTPPLSRFELKQGHPVQIRFITGVSSDAPGQFRAMVSQPVFDTATGLHILIPQGSTVVGSYDQMMQLGSERLPAGATRIIFPGQSNESLDLGTMPLSDQAGYAGLRDKVDRHVLRLVFNTALMGLAGAGAQLTQPQNGGGFGGGISSSQILAAQLGLQFGQVGAEYARRELQTKPTHLIRPGYTATIILAQDVAFPGEWVPGVGMIPAATATGWRPR